MFTRPHRLSLMSESILQDTAKSNPQTLFYVYHQGEQSGPVSLTDIAARVRSRALDLNDYIYDEAASDWIVIVAHPGLSESIKDVKPASSVTPTGPVAKVLAPAVDGHPNEWFALKGNLRFGPFAYTEIIHLLQEKSMYDSDFVWHAGLKEWKKVADLPDFHPEAIRKLRELGQTKLNEVFFRRRHARIQHDGSILMHNNQKVFRGTSLEISAGGAGIMLETAALEVGNQVFLHFKPASELPPFNAVCEIVSRRPVNSADVLAPIHYGVKFLKIESTLTDAIENLALRVTTKKVA